MPVLKTIGTVIIWIIGILLLLSSVAKFIQPTSVVDAFTTWGLEDYIYLIGVIELLVAIFLLVPFTRKFGSFLVFAYFGGAIVTHLIAREITNAVFLVVFLIVFTIVLFFVYPRMIRR